MHYNHQHYTLDIVPEHRQKFIDLRIEKIFRDYEIDEWSLDSVELIKKIFNKKLINLIYTFVPNIVGNFDAEARYYPEEDIYIILINKNRAQKSYPYRRSKDRRLNFTLAHELGHIFLDHLLIPDKLKSPRKKYLENEEANEFAGRLLMPKDKLLSCNFISLEKVAEKFKVSRQAIWKRLNNLKRLDLLESEISYVCETCGNSEISPGAEQCRICGEDIYNNDKGVIPVKYEGFELDENSHALECPICGNEDFRPPKVEYDSYGNKYFKSSLYCRICSSLIVNCCTNADCEELVEGNSRYCEYCGSPTTFFKINYLPPWEDGTTLSNNRKVKLAIAASNVQASPSGRQVVSINNQEDEIAF